MIFLASRDIFCQEGIIDEYKLPKDVED